MTGQVLTGGWPDATKTVHYPSPPERDPAYVEYRRANRPYRRAFGRGERWRRILLAVGEATARAKDAS